MPRRFIPLALPRRADLGNGTGVAHSPKNRATSLRTAPMNGVLTKAFAKTDDRAKRGRLLFFLRQHGLECTSPKQVSHAL